MSGNTTRLAVSLCEGDFGGLVRLSVALASFVVGNALGVILARFSGRRAAPILVCCAMLLALSAVWPFDWNVPALVAAILAMGMLNAVVEQVNGLPIGLTLSLIHIYTPNLGDFVRPKFGRTKHRLTTNFVRSQKDVLRTFEAGFSNAGYSRICA